MDNLTRVFHEMQFELAFQRKKFAEFQDFFSEIMEKRYPGDFIRVRPSGRSGDRKNDGYLKSERKLFQVYAPLELGDKAACDKIDEDFQGAYTHWSSAMDAWVFVHNCRTGLGPDTTAKLLSLDGTNGVQVSWCGYPELREIVFTLDGSNIAALLGPAPNSADVQSVRFSDLELVIRDISQQPMPANPDIRPVPQGKLQANRLSGNVEILLSAGMWKSHLVGTFFSEWHDPGLGDRVAAAFRKRYEECRDQGMYPDDIFRAMYVFAEGSGDPSPGRQAAVLAVLAFFFEECDIFERPRLGTTT